MVQSRKDWKRKAEKQQEDAEKSDKEEDSEKRSAKQELEKQGGGFN